MGITFIASTKRHEAKINTLIASVIMAVTSVAFVVMFSACSYFNTIGAYGQKARIEQRQASLALYVKYANVPTGVKGNLISDLTDKKYEDYQQTLGGFIDDLKRLIESYNTTVSQKIALKQGFLFGMLVHCPEDLKIVKML